MNVAWTAIAWVLCTVGLSAWAGEGERFAPFAVDWRAPAESPASVAFLLDAPAGKEGFVRATDGHLVQPSGKRWRIWGVNMTGKACFPSKEDAPRLAARMAQFGLNCVRFHFLDQLAPRGLIDAARDDTRALDASQLDRLDFFVGELKKRGIYTNLNLNVARTYKPGDGVRDYALLGFAKGLTYFDPRLLELQKEYTRQLLTHRNTYTGNEYRHEPAVAIVEFLNENSLVESWVAGRLLGQNTRKNPGTWTDIPASYEKDVTDLFNAWLAKHVTPETLVRLRQEAGVGAEAAIPRLRPDQFGKASKERFQTEAAFYVDVERRFHDETARYLREDLGVKSLLVGTSDHGHSKSGYPLLSTTSRLDVVDGHVYWQHPNYTTDAGTGRKTGFTIANTPMVNNPTRSTVVQLARSAVAGRPYTVSEVNHPFPHEYACEGIPILAAYAALQDWDGIFWYTLGHDDVATLETRTGGHFDLACDPVKMSQLAAGALVFLRGDVRAATECIDRSYTHQQVLESLRARGQEGPFFTAGFPLVAPLVHRTRILAFDRQSPAYPSIDAADPIRSDTGELAWWRGGGRRGEVVVETPRSQALVGFVADGARGTSHLAAQVKPEFCAITLGALDEQPIGRSSRLLLTAGARVAYEGMRWNDRRTSLVNWGKPPIQIDVVTGEITLRGLEQAKEVQVQPLDGAGRAQAGAIAATKNDAGWTFAIGQPATTWYVISVRR